MPLNSASRYTGRNVTIITVIVGLIGAAAPVVANMDLSSSAGIVAALVALSAVVVKYLDGSQQYEARLDATGAEAAVAAAEPGERSFADEPEEEFAGEPAGDDEVADVPDPPGDGELEELRINAREPEPALP